jgi:hypothetical protein
MRLTLELWLTRSVRGEEMPELRMRLRYSLPYLIESAEWVVGVVVIHDVVDGLRGRIRGANNFFGKELSAFSRYRNSKVSNSEPHGTDNIYTP